MKSEFLNTCQVETPIDVVKGMWQIAHRFRKSFGRVIDLGAGDGRFSRFGGYGEYVGLEIDKQRIPSKKLRACARIEETDAFACSSDKYDLCIGNPPYIRASRLNPEWREEAVSKLEQEAAVRLLRNANLFVHFITLGLLRTHEDGLVVQLVPFEWVSRPSARGLREYIDKNRWHVDVYRFSEDVFDRVMTTASIAVIDKARRDGGWSYFQLDRDFTAFPVSQPSGTSRKVLDYSERHAVAYALRGLSPGGQDIFTLNEYERMFYGLKIDTDVTRCVTTLKPVPDGLESLTKSAYEKHYVDAGRKCWLVRSDRENISSRLRGYLQSVGDGWKRYSTCTEREIWWRYRIHPVPPILVASGFTNFGPKIVRNQVGAVAVGSVYAVFAKGKERIKRVSAILREFDFEKRVVSHSNELKKIEVRQLNGILASIAKVDKKG